MHSPFSQKELETLYGAAYGMYGIGDYEKSAELFTKLVLHAPQDARFWQGLASSQQMHRQFEAALHAWSIFCLLSNHNPEGHFHAAECYLSLENVEETKKALDCAIFHLKKGHPLSDRILQLKEHVEHG